AQTTAGNAALRGAAVGLLFGDGQLAPPELVTHLRGHLFSARGNGAEGPRFLRGLLRAARSALWQAPGPGGARPGRQARGCRARVLEGGDEARFIRQLPNLRLAFADLTPRECDQVAREVAGQAGVAALELIEETQFGSADMVHGAEVNRRVVEGLRRDGLEDFG